MNSPAKAGPVERIVVPLDATSEHLTAIETAARLAQHAKAPLHGIFVEDEDLLRLASLPFARQTTLGAPAEALTKEHLELHLQVAAARARRELFAAARRHGVKCSFEIVRGASESALVAASEHDLVVAGGAARPIGGHFRLEARWWSSIAVTPSPFLLARHAWRESGSVVTLLRDRSPASVRLLQAATRIAEAADRPLTVICPPAVAGAERFESWIADRLAGHTVRVQVEIAPAEPAALRQRLDELDLHLLAISAGGDELREFVERFACDILIVR